MICFEMGTMKILIHDERPDTLECLLEGIVNRGYKGGIAKDGLDVINMLSDERYNIVLTNGDMKSQIWISVSGIKFSSVFIIGIANTEKRDEKMDSKVDLCLRRPFEASELWQPIASKDFIA
jgi:DNA-binding response OmpR family regulator